MKPQHEESTRALRVRRWIARVILILAVGVVINIAVTVGIASWVNILGVPESSRGGMGPHNGIGVSTSIFRRFGSELVSITETPQPHGRTRPGPVEALPHWIDAALYPSPDAIPEGLQMRQRKFQARGWPWLCAWCQERGFLKTVELDEPVRRGIEGALELPLAPVESWTGSSKEPRLLPLRPIWKGLLLNSLLYAFFAGLIALAFFRWRCLWRYRRGRCPRCRQDLQGDYRRPCPRCGHLHPGAKDVRPSAEGMPPAPSRGGNGTASKAGRKNVSVLCIALMIAGFVGSLISTVIIAATVNPYREGMAGLVRVFDGVKIEVWRIDAFGTSYLRINEERDPERPFNSRLDPLERIPHGLNPEFLGSADDPSVEYRSRSYELRGWPWRCVWCETQHVLRPSYEAVPLKGPRLKLPLLPGWEAPGAGRPTRRILPLQPIWLGLGLNTLFYALLLAIVLLVFRRALNLRRFARGRCPRCGYDRRFVYVSPCPECGG